ncbi:MAG: glycosyltransferase family 4 protein, partial [Candidatus Omnitrophica bacterium]|nr:glycosyltransferase family 4 protein [Candidatus Omnitrophota bacterium]
IADNIKIQYKKEAVIIPNGVVMPEIMKTDDALKKYGLEKGKYILVVGRFVPEKGFHDLIESFKQLSAMSDELSANSWNLVIVGDADHEDDYSRGLKQNAQENENIVLTGFLTGQPLQELYSHAGLFVLPSYHEGLPIVLLEAMSYGLSCIVSDIPANREVCLDAQRYFKPGDNEDLVGKLRQFIAKPLSSEEQNKQRQLSAKDYNWEEIAKKTIKVYQGIA